MPNSTLLPLRTLGHQDITTTEIYLHVAMGVSGLGVTRPLDEMAVGGGVVDALAGSMTGAVCGSAPRAVMAGFSG